MSKAVKFLVIMQVSTVAVETLHFKAGFYYGYGMFLGHSFVDPVPL